MRIIGQLTSGFGLEIVAPVLRPEHVHRAALVLAFVLEAVVLQILDAYGHVPPLDGFVRLQPTAVDARVLHLDIFELQKLLVYAYPAARLMQRFVVLVPRRLQVEVLAAQIEPLAHGHHNVGIDCICNLNVYLITRHANISYQRMRI